MKNYDDLISEAADTNCDYFDELNKDDRLSLIVSYLYNRYSKDANIDCLYSDAHKLADFLSTSCGIEKDQLKAFKDFHNHLIETLTNSLEDVVTTDINDHRSFIGTWAEEKRSEPKKTFDDDVCDINKTWRWGLTSKA